MYILSLNYNTPLEDVDKCMDEHIEFLKKQYDAGIFVMSGRKVPRTGGIILARNVSLEELSKIISEDPFHKNGVAEYEVTQFLPTMIIEELAGLKENI
ncbi:YciI family protein [Maridesulfovibrio frigidus]|uniref:YciI family protein n=1 Tax=Maridesulfovibrio frigidus TaxID=340956 RepID=UPI0004E12217|nr:YciI family protein [Maridesulfovibrio frigidus]